MKKNSALALTAVIAGLGLGVSQLATNAFANDDAEAGAPAKSGKHAGKHKGKKHAKGKMKNGCNAAQSCGANGCQGEAKSDAAPADAPKAAPATK